MEFIWREMVQDDLAAISAIAAIVHPNYPEDDAVLAEKLALYPAGCFVLLCGTQICGYLFSHPWMAGTAPKLDALIGQLPTEADTYFVHDLALLRETRGVGAGAAIVARLADLAVGAGFTSMSLCSVSGAERFWQAQGFVLTQPHETDTMLASYGQDVHFMRRSLSSAA